MPVIDVAIVVGWIAFWLYWLAASLNAKSGRTSWQRFAGIRVAIILIALFLLRMGVFKGRNAITRDPWLQGVGMAIFVLGLGLAVWARIYIGRNWGMPMSRKDDPELVTTGPYATIRHPIYAGIIAGMIGTAIAASLYWLVAAALLGGYFLYSALMEERFMAKEFPDAYPQYRARTKMLIPFVV